MLLEIFFLIILICGSNVISHVFVFFIFTSDILAYFEMQNKKLSISLSNFRVNSKIMFCIFFCKSIKNFLLLWISNLSHSIVRAYILNVFVWLFSLAGSKNVLLLDQIKVLKHDVRLIWIMTLLTLFRKQMGWRESPETEEQTERSVCSLCTATTHHFIASSYRLEVLTSQTPGLASDTQSSKLDSF